MRVLVTGGSGFVGSHVTDRLAAEGHDPLVFDLCRLVCNSDTEKTRRDFKELTRPGSKRNS